MAHATLSDHIISFPETLSGAQCQSLIDKFEASGHQELCQREGGHSFSQVNISQHWPEIAKNLSEVFQVYLGKYQMMTNAAFWPALFQFENIRMKRYMPNGRDLFPVHVDVMGQQAAKRFMTAILYLNTPGGGETTFPHLGLSVEPEPGKLVAFPPLWLFPHEGRPPLERPKYILHTYMCYPM